MLILISNKFPNNMHMKNFRHFKTYIFHLSAYTIYRLTWKVDCNANMIWVLKSMLLTDIFHSWKCTDSKRNSVSHSNIFMLFFFTVLWNDRHTFKYSIIHDTPIITPPKNNKDFLYAKLCWKWKKIKPFHKYTPFFISNFPLWLRKKNSTNLEPFNGFFTFFISIFNTS